MRRAGSVTRKCTGNRVFVLSQGSFLVVLDGTIWYENQNNPRLSSRDLGPDAPGSPAAPVLTMRSVKSAPKGSNKSTQGIALRTHMVLAMVTLTAALKVDK